MSFIPQLRSVFNDEELAILQEMAASWPVVDRRSSMTTREKRTLQSIRDKLSGAELIRNSKTTPPSKL